MSNRPIQLLLIILCCIVLVALPLTSQDTGTSPFPWEKFQVWPAVPTGGVLLMLSGACPAGYTENDTLSGRMMIVTTAGNMDQGGTGGNDTITPAGSNSTVSFTPAGSNNAPAISWPVGVPTFSGSALAGHTHTVTPTGTNGATATSGNSAGTNIAAGTGSLTAAKATAPNLTVPAETFTGASDTTSSVSAGTPAGTVAWPAGVPTQSAPTFTGQSGTVPAQTFSGNSFDNRSTFVKVLMCVKN